ncbi:MAG: CvpA family protein [Rikenellaceae bacterium]|nr:CvpA family protein [Rikenellaceae bacterium]
MNLLDIIFVILFIYALVKGYRAGLILELCGIVGVIAAAYLSYRLADEIAVSLFPSFSFSYPLSFVIVFVAVLVVIGMAARVVSRVINFTGMGMINKMCGAVASFLKMAIVLAVFVALFNGLNNMTGWIKRDSLRGSAGYVALLSLSDTFFPRIDFKGPAMSEEILRGISEQLGTGALFMEGDSVRAPERKKGPSPLDSVIEVLRRKAADTSLSDANGISVATVDIDSIVAKGGDKIDRIINIIAE